MRMFKDEQGRAWVASVGGERGLNYKGRYYFLVEPEAGEGDEAVALKDVRWNNERTAQRTLDTMSEVELRRRLRQARGRGRPDAGAA